MTPPLPYELHTERLRLRRFGFRDLDDVFAYASPPEFGTYLAVAQPYTLADAEDYLARMRLADWSTSSSWAIEHQGRAVGSIRLERQPGHRKAELGWGLAPALWGRGIVVEAARAVIDLGFTNLAWLDRVDAHADLRNSASLRVAEKLGMTREGTLRSFLVIRDQPVDVVWYSLLRREWSA